MMVEISDKSDESVPEGEEKDGEKGAFLSFVIMFSTPILIKRFRFYDCTMTSGKSKSTEDVPPCQLKNILYLLKLSVSIESNKSMWQKIQSLFKRVHQDPVIDKLLERNKQALEKQRREAGLLSYGAHSVRKFPTPPGRR
ncbi:MAG: hypothetical protein V3R94_04930 [Acidobacteriota bacterium]